MFNESVAGNSQFYGSLADVLELAKRKDVEIVSITVYGAASPEGGIGYNIRFIEAACRPHRFLHC